MFDDHSFANAAASTATTSALSSYSAEELRCYVEGADDRFVGYTQSSLRISPR
jgi:hypothetical protein